MHDKGVQYDLNEVIKEFEQHNLDRLISLEGSIGKQAEQFELNGDQESVILNAVKLLGVQYLGYKKSVKLVYDPKSPESFHDMLQAGVFYMKAKTSFAILIYKIISANILKDSTDRSILLNSLKSFHSKHWQNDNDYLDVALKDGRYSPPSAENEFIPQETTIKHALKALFPETNGELPLAESGSGSGSGCLLLLPQFFLGALTLNYILNSFC